MTSKIQALSEKTINKIAAGEVVERPSSVVKELIENSIDAHSKSITIEINEGGKKLIRITDDGDGIESNDLKIAFLRHTTSKIKNVEDMNSLATLGFRGEALASIVSVSQTEIISKTKDSLSGCQISIYGGDVIDNKEIGCPIGTTIIVKNIFYNIPVRKKFLKSDTVEASYISDMVYKLALGNPNISIKYIKNNKLIIKTPGDGNTINTIYSLFGKDFTNALLKCNNSSEDIKIHGYIAKNSYARGNRKHQYCFVNGRYIKSELISEIVEMEYKSLIPINQYPVYVLYLEIPFAEVDVNVHPTKIEVRFKEPEKIRNHLSTVVKQTLSQNNLIPDVSIDAYSNKDLKNKPMNYIDGKVKDKIFENEMNKKDDRILIIESKCEDIVNTEDIIEDQLNVFEKKNNVESYNIQKSNQVFSNNYDNNDIEENDNNIIKIPELKIIGSLFRTYILAEDIQEHVFYMIDQHASHERIMYEKYKKQFEQETILIQELLTYEIVELIHDEYQKTIINKDIFMKLGFLIEPFGSNSIIIRGIPMIFGKPDTKELFLEILDKLDSNIKSSYQFKLPKIAKMACVSAIKAGDKNSEIEIEKLLMDLRNCDNPYTCPHGRPTIIKMSQYEIEKKFKRIQ